MTEGSTSPDQRGALRRREGRYSSHLTCWRRQRDAGAWAGLAARQRGRPAPVPDVHGPRLAAGSARTNTCASACSRRPPSSTSKKSFTVAGARPASARAGRQALMTTAATLGAQVGVVRACHSLGVARATFYRQRARDAAPATVPAVVRPAPPLKLTPAARDHALTLLQCRAFHRCLTPHPARQPARRRPVSLRGAHPLRILAQV